MAHSFTLLFAFIVIFDVFGKSICKLNVHEYNGKEAWGYVNVRKDANMFWWLYYADSSNYSSYPLIIWLQGGPGASSTGYGNFQEIGPLDVHLKPRNTSWVSKGNLLFLDNPVGTGFSYVTKNSSLCTNNTQIAEDLLATLASLLQNIPEFQKTPLYIFGESYGGKMAIDFSLTLYKAIKSGKVVCNFKGVALGDSWISPYHSVATWGDYLYTMGLVNKAELMNITDQVTLIRKALQTKQLVVATKLWNDLEGYVSKVTNGVDFYNILKNEGVPKMTELNKFPKHHFMYSLYQRHVAKLYTEPLDKLMNGPIKEKLHVIPKNVTWGGQSSKVMDALKGDFMIPVIDSVETLLNETAISVNVYSGQLDLIVDTLGTLQWMETLNWPGMKDFLKAKKVPIEIKNCTVAFVTSFKNLRFFSILKAGHMVPSDAAEAALNMVDIILGKS